MKQRYKRIVAFLVMGITLIVSIPTTVKAETTLSEDDKARNQIESEDENNIATAVIFWEIMKIEDYVTGIAYDRIYYSEGTDGNTYLMCEDFVSKVDSKTEDAYVKKNENQELEACDESTISQYNEWLTVCMPNPVELKGKYEVTEENLDKYLPLHEKSDYK